MFVEGDDGAVDRLVVLALAEETPTRAGMLLMWASLAAENSGDLTTAQTQAEEALGLSRLTPFLRGSLHAQFSALTNSAGDHRASAHHAEAAWPLLSSLGAHDDARSMRIAMAMAPLVEGDLERAARILDEAEQHSEGVQTGSRMVLLAARAEGALASGQVAEGLRGYDEAVAVTLGEVEQAIGLTPWLLIAAAGSLVAHVHHGTTAAHAARAREFRDLLRGQATIEGGRPVFADFPLNGIWVVALGAWALGHGGPDLVEDGVRLLAAGHRWAYEPEPADDGLAGIAALAERHAPGRLDVLLAEDAGRPAEDGAGRWRRTRSHPPVEGARTAGRRSRSRRRRRAAPSRPGR